MNVFPADVLAFLGQPTEGADTAALEAHINAATVMVKAYTRSGGFDVAGDPVDDVAAVITSCAARMHANPTNDRNQGIGPFQTSPGIFNGWTLPERAVLHQYRRRAL